MKLTSLRQFVKFFFVDCGTKCTGCEVEEQFSHVKKKRTSKQTSFQSVVSSFQRGFV